MKFLKRVSLIIAAASMVLVIGGCSNTTEDVEKNVFSLLYESTQEVDKIIYSIWDLEGEVTPVLDDEKLKEGYETHIVMEDGVFDLSIKIIDDGQVIYEKTNEKVDLSDGKNVEAKIVTNKDGNIDIEIKEKK